jgi:hypothetical protein
MEKGEEYGKLEGNIPNKSINTNITRLSPAFRECSSIYKEASIHELAPGQFPIL